MSNEIKYNKRCRMEYNPDFHARHGIPWTKEEDDYLMYYYKYDGLKMLSYALEKTENAINARYEKLRVKGYKSEWLK